MILKELFINNWPKVRVREGLVQDEQTFKKRSHFEIYQFGGGTIVEKKKKKKVVKATDG